MKISRRKLASEAQATGFRPEVMEKVMQLLALLQGMNSHPFLKGRWVLKGGTALNLFQLDLPRLSVDIDLNYIGALDRETMLAERPRFEQALQAVCSREGVGILRQPIEHAGGEWRLRYDSALGPGGRLEVDVNFMFRVPLWPVTIRDARVGSSSARRIPVLDLHELASGKLAALLARQAGRDLFDVHQLLTGCDLDREKLRLGFVLYGGMNRRDWRTVKIDDVGCDERELRDQLAPVVRRDLLARWESGHWAEGMIAECRRGMEVVLPLNASELAFLDSLLSHGRIEPGLLTSDPAMAERIRSHPSLRWKAENVREHRGR